MDILPGPWPEDAPASGPSVDYPRHPAASARANQWRRCRTCYDGVDAVRACGIEFLPELSTQHTEYKSYLKRAPYYPAFARTVDGLAGCVMRRTPTIETSPQLADEIHDIDGFGLPLTALAELALRELLVTGRVGLSLDIVAGSVRWSIHEAEDILSWHSGLTASGDPVLMRVAVRESVYQPASGEPREIERHDVIREWTHNGDAVTVRRMMLDGTTLTEATLALPGGAPLPRIPFWFADLPGGRRPGIQHLPAKPPLLDLADLSLSHYRTGADLEHALHWVALPTPVYSGDEPDKPLVIGSTHAWYLGENGDAKMLEVSGAGLAALEQALTRKQGQMAAIGARLVAEPTRAAETAEAVRLKSGGDHSLLHTIVDTAERAIAAALVTHADWAGLPADPPRVRLNRDFIDARIDANDVAQLFATLQGGALSRQSFLEALYRGEWIDTPPDEEVDRLESEGATIPPAPATSPMNPPAPPEPDAEATNQ